jgi:hypothetical protein
MKDNEKCTEKLVIKLTPTAHHALKERAFKAGVPMSKLAKKALFKRDGSLRL